MAEGYKSLMIWGRIQEARYALSLTRSKDQTDFWIARITELMVTLKPIDLFVIGSVCGDSQDDLELLAVFASDYQISEAQEETDDD